MLLLVFRMGDERYGLEARRVAEVVPRVRFRRLPGAPEYVCGLLRYRGGLVPVLDLQELAGLGRSTRRLSTRIVLVDYPDRRGNSRILGLLAERVTDTLKVNPEDLQDPGIRSRESAYLGGVVTDSEGTVQCVRVEDLLPETVKEMLFPADEK